MQFIHVPILTSLPKDSTLTMTKKKSVVPSNETPEARFIRVATLKTNSVLKALKSLSRLTGKKAVSTVAQREAIGKAIFEAYGETMKSLAGQKPETAGFKL